MDIKYIMYYLCNMKIEVTAKYKISDRVFHVTKDSLEGVVVDVTYSALTRLVRYVVTFSQADSDYYYEHELQDHKSF